MVAAATERKNEALERKLHAQVRVSADQIDCWAWNALAFDVALCLACLCRAEVVSIDCAG